LRDSSLKTIAKPARGGVSNALFVWASVESLPPELNGIATEITINYPWGSLLHALVEPNLDVLKNIAQLGQTGASMTILINITPFENEEYRQKLGLPELNMDIAKNHLVPRYREAGIDIQTVKLLDKDIPNTTTWGQKLTQGSGSRKTLLLKGVIR
jgi:16S rRNA (adenine(1408)-N(1))-methyltransferase